jgi:hypothetical protein
LIKQLYVIELDNYGYSNVKYFESVNEFKKKMLN